MKAVLRFWIKYHLLIYRVLETKSFQSERKNLHFQLITCLTQQKSNKACSETMWVLKSAGSNITQDEPKKTRFLKISEIFTWK